VVAGSFAVTTFGGAADQDVAAWLARFRRVQDANSWDARRANAALKASLVGAVEQWLAAQDDSEAKLDTQEKTEAALKTAFSPVNAH
jgi:hypothetical protein